MVTTAKQFRQVPVMSDISQRPRADFSRIWPFAGNLFLFLFAAWLGYMGWAAEADDLKTAFFGLSGVSALLLLLGLRSAASPRRRGAMPPPASFERYDDGTADASTADAGAPQETAVSEDGMPLNARARERLGGGGAVDAPPRAQGLAVSAAAASDWPDERPSAAQSSADRGAAVPPGEDPDDDPGGGERTGAYPSMSAIERLRADMARDKALRGARMTRVENTMEQIGARLDALAGDLEAMRAAAGTGEAGEAGALAAALTNRIERLEERLAAPSVEAASPGGAIDLLSERIAAVEAAIAAANGVRTDAGLADGSDLANRIEALEEALAGMPALGERLARLEVAQRPEADAAAAGSAGLFAALEERLAALEGAAPAALHGRIDALEERLAGAPGVTPGRLEALDQRLAALESAMAERPAASPAAAGDEAVAAVTAVTDRLAALEKEVRDRPSAPAPDLADELKNYLSIPFFNQTMNQKVVPQLRQIVERRVDEALTTEALRERIAPLLKAAEPSSAGAPADGEAEALQAALAAERAARERLVEELAAVRALAETAAASVPSAAPIVVDGADGHREALNRLAEARAQDREEIDALRAAVEGLGQPAPDGIARQVGEIAARIDAVEERSIRRLEEATRAVSSVRENLNAITQHVARMGESYQELVQRVERLGDARPPERPAAPAVNADVEALRDALTTIIEQNREIRQQQDMLTARFDRPTRVEIDTHGDETR